MSEFIQSFPYSVNKDPGEGKTVTGPVSNLEHTVELGFELGVTQAGFLTAMLSVWLPGFRLKEPKSPDTGYSAVLPAPSPQLLRD